MRKIIIALFIFTSVAFGQKTKDEILYEKFIDEAYGFNFENAEGLADSLLGVYPESPFGFHALSLLQTWYYLGSRNEGILRTFFIYSDSVLAKYDALNNFDENPYYLFRLGEEYSFRAMMFAFDLKKFDAFWAVKKAIAYYDDAIDVDESFYDAYAGPAVFGYFLSFAPSFLKAGLFFLGIETDMDKNIKAFKLAFEKGDISKTEAAFQLSKIYSDYYFDTDSSNYFLDYLLQKYPENIFFRYQYAINLIRSKEPHRAAETLTAIAEYGNENFIQIKAFSYFLLGEVYFSLNDFSKAAKFYDKYFENARSINFLGYANYKCGLANYFTGNKAKAREYFLLSSYGNDENYKDEFAYERSMKILESNFRTIDKNLIMAENFIQSGDYESALKYIEKSPLKTFRALSAKAEAAIMSRKFNEAQKTLTDLSRIVNEEDKTEYANYLYLNALYFYEKKDFADAKKSLYRLFDFDNKNNELFAKARFLGRKLGIAKFD